MVVQQMSHGNFQQVEKSMMLLEMCIWNLIQGQRNVPIQMS